MNEEIIVLEDELEIIEEIEITESDVIVSDAARHNTLVDRNDKDSHIIGAITGLREELDAIEAPRTIESNMPQQADYYKWEDVNKIPTLPYGLFVSLHTYIANEETGVRNGTGNIQICDGTIDVFGVTVEKAGFVGNQEYIDLGGGNKIGRDEKYSLVIHSGVVAVQRQTDVAVGDYVVPDAFGKAKKSDGKYGYLVVELSEQYGVPCAVISLSAPSTIAKQVSDTLYDGVSGLVVRMEGAEADIGSLSNSIQNVYDELKQENEGMSNSNDKNFGDISDRLDKVEGTLEGFEGSVYQAALQSSVAYDTAISLRQEAVEVANDAVTRVDEVQREIQALDYHIAPYSIGKYSQAYGLIYEQAILAVPKGSVHIPMREDSDDPYETSYEEMYDGYGIQRFSYGYYYTWKEDESDGKIKWIPSDTIGVKFVTDYQTVNETVQYLVAKEDIILEDGTVYLNKGDVLYYNNGEPTVVTSANQSGFSRAVNYLRKDINEYAVEITNARGDYAALAAKLDDEGARTSMIASLMVDTEEGDPKAIYPTEEELKANITVSEVDKDAYYCVGTKPPYKVYKWNDASQSFKEVINKYYDGVYFCKVNTASIIAGVNADDGDSFVGIDADKIDFTAEHYSAIAKHIELNADNIDLGGYVTFTTLQEKQGETFIHGGNIQTENLSAICADLGTVEAGVIQSKDYTERMIWGASTTLSPSEGLNYRVSSSDILNIEGIGKCTDTDIIIDTYWDDILITWINSAAFKDCTNLTSVVMGNSVRRVGSQAFQGCTSLTSVTICGSVTSIGSSAFKGCSKLTEIIIPGSVTSINSDTFRGCANLTSVVIGDGVTSIGSYAFSGCSNLTSIKIPNSVTQIGNNAFDGCSALIKIDIPDSATSIGTNVFSNCTSLENVYYKGTYTKWGSVAVDLTNNADLAEHILYYSENAPTSSTERYWSYLDGFRISCDDTLINSKYFKVSKNGRIEAVDASLSGEIIAESGSIGDFKIEDGVIYSGGEAAKIFGNNDSIVGEERYEGVCLSIDGLNLGRGQIVLNSGKNSEQGIEVGNYRLAQGLGINIQGDKIHFKNTKDNHSSSAQILWQDKDSQFNLPEGFYIRNFANMYPIGSIYMATSYVVGYTEGDKPEPIYQEPTHPAYLFGGSWEQIENRFLLAASSAHPVGETGGSAKIKKENLPNITLNVWDSENKKAVKVPNNYGGTGENTTVNAATSGNATSHGLQTEPIGNGVDYLPAYLSVYVWKRIE